MSRRSTTRLLASAILCALVLGGTSTLAGAASSSKASAAKISAHLTKKSFTSAQAKKVKLVYRFSAPSKSFGYRLTLKKGSKWKTIKSVKRTGNFKGSHKITVKKLFGRKPVKVGRYRLKLSADGGSKLLSFKVVKATPTGSKPANTALPIISGTRTQGQTLSSSNGSWSHSPTSYTRQWRRCNSSGASCADISGATSSSYILALADAGSTVRVVVTATNSYGSASATSSQTTAIAGLPPANTALPITSGTRTQGQTLSSSNGSWSNSPTSYAYQWRRCNSSGASCSNISGATSSSYALVFADAGYTLRVVVTASNAYGSASTTSSQTAVVSGLPPANTALPTISGATTSLPTISGTTTQGQKLIASSGSWTNSPTSYAYQWRRCDSSGSSCSDISGATSLSYVLAAADVSHTLRVVVTVSNSYGSASATSAKTAVVAAAVSAGAVSTGSIHTCALVSGGTVECWGDNDAYQLGNDTMTASSTPVRVSGITNATQISAGGDHTCALLSGGSIKCWGYNGDGELGDGVTYHGYSSGFDLRDASPIPVQVSGITNAIQISGGMVNTCAVLSGGTVKCWGDNGGHQLGDGVNDHGYTNPYGDDFSPTPVQVSGITNATQVSEGYSHTCALLSGGTVKCWGLEGLGNGTTNASSIPVQVSGITSATQISAGGDHTCALLSDGSIECWGYGRLGDGTTTDSSTPVQVSGITNATQVSASGHGTCAVLSGGSVECWGDNSYGELGNGTTTASSTPVQVSGITNATQVSAGVGHTCALLSGGSIKCWGANRYGQLGNGSEFESSIPVQVSGITSATQISAGGDHTCALLSGGSVECWGGTTRDSSTPAQVSGITSAAQVSAGGWHSCALLSGGTVKCWGNNYYGQLGDGTTTASSTPVQVSGITNATQVSAGGSHTCALLSGGTVKCWGANGAGQLGIGSVGNGRETPVQVSGITNASQISAGFGHTCALLSNGTIKCWGANEYGQLGDGTWMNTRSTPVQVSGITTATAISAGDWHSCAALSGGSVECWGYNEGGQLGNGTTTDSSTPVQVSGITSAAQVSASVGHTCALLSGGTIKCWGLFGLGNGTTNASSIPVQVSGITSAAQVSASGDHTCALLTGGTVECWGLNNSGQLGDGWFYSPTPVNVIGFR